MYKVRIVLKDEMFDLENTVEKRFSILENLTSLVINTTNDMLNFWDDLDGFGFDRNFKIGIDENNIDDGFVEVCNIYNVNYAYELTVFVKKV